MIEKFQAYNYERNAVSISLFHLHNRKRRQFFRTLPYKKTNKQTNTHETRRDTGLFNRRHWTYLQTTTMSLHVIGSRLLPTIQLIRQLGGAVTPRRGRLIVIVCQSYLICFYRSCKLTNTRLVPSVIPYSSSRVTITACHCSLGVTLAVIIMP